MNISILSGNDSDAQYENMRLIDELEKLECYANVIDYQTSTVLSIDHSDGLQIVSAGETSYLYPNAVITRINEPDPESVTRAKRFLIAFESLGIPLTASSAAVDLCKDKMSTYDKLVAEGIPTPRTVMPSLTEPDATAATTILPLLEYVEPNPNRQVIIKKVFGTKGIGVARADNRRSALPFIQMLVDSGVPILIQQYIATKRNGFYRDIRYDVVGEDVVAAMLRQSSNDFRTNLSLSTSAEGGVSDAYGRKYRMSRYHKELSISAARALGLGIAGVDILGAYVGEVNSSPGMQIEGATNTNLAQAMARYALYIANK